MTTVTIPITAYSAQSADLDRPYGQLASLPLFSGAANVYFRATLASKIPGNATVVSAKIQFRGRSAETGSYTATVQPVATDSPWNSNVTFRTRPLNVTGTAVAVTKSSPQIGDLWEWAGTALTADVQAIVSGTRIDRGWRLVAAAGNATFMSFAGTTAATGAPVMIVEYTVPPEAPENLHPAAGTVSIAKPVLTFDAVEDILSLQVQVDPAMNGTTPAFNSGTVAATGGYLDLAGTSYAGLAGGATTYWRARQQTAGGWSPWSDWVSFSRLALPAITLLSPPSGAVEDPTPPFQWSFGGTQVAWMARLLDASGAVLASSGYQPGTATNWTPIRGFTTSGQTGTFELRVWDDAERVATAGDPEYARLTLALTYTLDPTVDPMDTLVAAMAPDGLGVQLTATRAGGISDEVVVFRDSQNIATHVGTSVFTGTTAVVVDPLPPLGKPVQYRLAPRVGGSTASGGPTVTITPAAKGIWLIDAEDTDDRVLIRTESGAPEQSQPEQAIVHLPLNEVGGFGQVVRRRLVRYRPQGTVNGVLVGDTAGEALLRKWAEGDAGHRFLLAFSGFSGTVIIGDLEFPERDNPRQDRVREVGVKFGYWGQQ